MTPKTVLVAALFMTAVSVRGSEGLRVRVSPEMSYEPARITVQVSVDPNRDNRALEVVVESGSYFRSSEAQLEGDGARRTNVFQYYDLPAGEYDVRATLFGTDGRERATTRSSVMVIR